MTREEKVTLVHELRAQNLTLREIAARTGYKTSWVGELCKDIPASGTQSKPKGSDLQTQILELAEHFKISTYSIYVLCDVSSETSAYQAIRKLETRGQLRQVDKLHNSYKLWTV